MATSSKAYIDLTPDTKVKHLTYGQQILSTNKLTNVLENLNYNNVYSSLQSAQNYARSSAAYVGEQLNVVEEDDAKCYVVLNEEGDLKEVGATIPLMISIKHADLLELVYNNLLIPGCQYRITDYVATTNMDSFFNAPKADIERRRALKNISALKVAQDTTPDGPREFDINVVQYKSANKPFDIIVTADDTHTLNENARCVKHEISDGELDMFEGCILEAWEIKYSIFNDSFRFAWADDSAHGKGVIYWMKDEYGNEAPYDFKGILFGSYFPDENIYQGISDPAYYTFCLIDSGYEDWNDPSTYYENVFDDTGKVDEEFSGDVNLRPQKNKIAAYITNGRQYLNGIVFSRMSKFDRGPCGNEFKENCAVCMFYRAEGCDNNLFGYGCALIVISMPIDFDDQTWQYHGAVGNVFKDYCSDIIIDSSCWNNTINEYAYAIKIGYECRFIEIGALTTSITVKPCCNMVKIGSNSYNVTVGSRCNDIYVGCINHDVNIGNGSSCIRLNENNEYIVTDENCNRISIDRSCHTVELGYNVTDTRIGYNAVYNTIGTDCSNINIGNNCYGIRIPDNNTCINIGNKCQAITLTESNSTVTIENCCEVIKLLKPMFDSVVVQMNNKGIYIDTAVTVDSVYTKHVEVQQACNQNAAEPKILLVEDAAGNQTYKTTFANNNSIVKIVD